MIWASANKELAVTPVHDDFEETIAPTTSGASTRPHRPRRRGAAPHRDRPRPGAIAAALAKPLAELVQPDASLAGRPVPPIDSCLKRYRRVKVVQALKGLPVDIYGENWQQHVGTIAVVSPADAEPEPQPRLQPHLPALRRAGQLRSELRPRHQRARGLGAGARYPDRQQPQRAHRRPGRLHCIPLRRRSIRDAAEQLLGYGGEVPLSAEFTWEYLVCRCSAKSLPKRHCPSDAMQRPSAATRSRPTPMQCSVPDSPSHPVRRQLGDARPRRAPSTRCASLRDAAQHDRRRPWPSSSRRRSPTSAPSRPTSGLASYPADDLGRIGANLERH